MSLPEVSLMDIQSDNHPEKFYEVLRGKGGLAYDRESGALLVANDKDIKAIMDDPVTFPSDEVLLPVYMANVNPEIFPTLGKIAHWPATTAGTKELAVHAKAMSAMKTIGFPTNARRLEKDQPMLTLLRRHALRAIVGLAARADDAGRANLMEDYALVLPREANIEIVGLPEGSSAEVERHSQDQISLVWGQPSAEEQVSQSEGLVNLALMTQRIVKERMALKKRALALGLDPADVLTANDVITKLVLEGSLSDDEMSDLAFNLDVAGHETTASSIGKALRRVLETPDGWQDLIAHHNDDEYLKGVADTLLHEEAAIHGWKRRTARDVTIGGVDIPENTTIILLLQSGNNDPERKGASVTFGYGIHYCIGAAIARQELFLTLKYLPKAHPDLRLAPGFVDQSGKYARNVGFHRLLRLPVEGVTSLKELEAIAV